MLGNLLGLIVANLLVDGIRVIMGYLVVFARFVLVFGFMGGLVRLMLLVLGWISWMGYYGGGGVYFFYVFSNYH